MNPAWQDIENYYNRTDNKPIQPLVSQTASATERKQENGNRNGIAWNDSLDNLRS
jgi:hypothetical protein